MDACREEMTKRRGDGEDSDEESSDSTDSSDASAREED